MSKILPLLPLAFLASLGTFVLAWGEDSHVGCDSPGGPCRTPDLTGVMPDRTLDDLIYLKPSIPERGCYIVRGTEGGHVVMFLMEVPCQ